jgi:hypothetical protein
MKARESFVFFISKSLDFEMILGRAWKKSQFEYDGIICFLNEKETFSPKA